MSPSAQSQSLLWHGVLLFLLGLGSGLALLAGGAAIANPRMMLAAHLVGTTNGMFLMLVGLMVPRLKMSEKLGLLLRGLALFGSYGNWVGTTLAAIWGTGALTPIAGAGRLVIGWQEAIVGGTLNITGGATLAVCGILLWALWPAPRESDLHAPADRDLR